MSESESSEYEDQDDTIIKDVVFLISFQRNLNKKAVLICQEVNENCYWKFGSWERNNLKKGINFYCPCVLMKRVIFKKMIQTQTYRKSYFQIIHTDDEYVFICQTRSDTQDETIPWPFHLKHEPTSLQFQCIANIIAKNLIEQANKYLPKGIINILNEFCTTHKLPYITRMTWEDDLSYKCRKKWHKFKLVRNLNIENWNEESYDLTEGFQYLGL
jgi:hypothetical protein